MTLLTRLAAGGALSLALIGSGRAGAIESSEREIKAAFVYNFAKYVKWPDPVAGPTSGDPLQICVVGSSPFIGELETAVSGKQVNGRQVVARSVRYPTEAQTCAIAFVSGSELSRVDSIVQQLGSRPILTVSDMPSFTAHGGVIGLRMEQNRVRFEVNMDAARKAGLKLSSQLLKVAVQITGQLEEPRRP